MAAISASPGATCWDVTLRLRWSRDWIGDQGFHAPRGRRRDARAPGPARALGAGAGETAERPGSLVSRSRGLRRRELRRSRLRRMRGTDHPGTPMIPAPIDTAISRSADGDQAAAGGEHDRRHRHAERRAEPARHVEEPAGGAATLRRCGAHRRRVVRGDEQAHARRPRSPAPATVRPGMGRGDREDAHAAAVIAIPSPGGQPWSGTIADQPPKRRHDRQSAAAARRARGRRSAGPRCSLSFEKERHGDEAAEEHDIREQRGADARDERGDPDERRSRRPPRGRAAGARYAASDERGSARTASAGTVHAGRVRLRRQRQCGETRLTGSPRAARCRGASIRLSGSWCVLLGQEEPPERRARSARSGR